MADQWQRVSVARSKGGRCSNCKGVVKPNQRIHKMWHPKLTGTTGHGNGKGQWWCQTCYMGTA